MLKQISLKVNLLKPKALSKSGVIVMAKDCYICGKSALLMTYK
jgi:hypothetical protein